MFISSAKQYLNHMATVVKSYPRFFAFSGISATTVTTAYYFKNHYFNANNNLHSRFIPGSKIRQVIPLEISLKKIKLKPSTIETRSPIYNDKTRIYEGYYLLDIFNSLGIDITKHEIIIFEAKDGFRSHIPSEFISKNKAFLAFKDASAPQGANWEIVFHPLNGNTDGGPFYLMWSDANIADNYWPFGVVNISFSHFRTVFGDIVPKNTKDPDIHRGFKIFAQNCSCCHTFFKKGGATAAAPDFEEIPAKYPVFGSIATYAANPQKNDVNSTMPKQYIPLSDLQKVEKYARHMVEKKSDST